MASCKDCVHFEVCRFKDLPAPLSDSYIRESECIEKRCGNFKDRYRFVKLTCRVGDTIYVLDYDNAIDEFFTKKKNIVEERHVRRIEIHKNNEFKIFDTFAYGEPPKKIGETMFFTKEAAEQELKKREENENNAPIT